MLRFPGAQTPVQGGKEPAGCTISRKHGVTNLGEVVLDGAELGAPPNTERKALAGGGASAPAVGGGSPGLELTSCLLQKEEPPGGPGAQGRSGSKARPWSQPHSPPRLPRVPVSAPPGQVGADRRERTGLEGRHSQGRFVRTRREQPESSGGGPGRRGAGIPTIPTRVSGRLPGTLKVTAMGR